MSYAITKRMSAASLDEAVERVRTALERQGFGILADIDFAATLKAKTGADIGSYRSLGACNPHFARQALEVDPDIGALLPCSVIIRSEADDFVISALDPVALMEAFGNPALAALAATVRNRIVWALSAAAEETSEEPMVLRAPPASETTTDVGLAGRVEAFRHRLAAMNERFQETGKATDASVEDAVISGPAFDELQRDMAALNGSFAHVLDFLDDSQRKSFVSRKGD